MSFCIWGPVTGILFHAMEYILPLNTLYPQKGQKQASNKRGQTLTARPPHQTSAQQ